MGSCPRLARFLFVLAAVLLLEDFLVHGVRVGDEGSGTGSASGSGSASGLVKNAPGVNSAPDLASTSSAPGSISGPGSGSGPQGSGSAPGSGNGPGSGSGRASAQVTTTPAVRTTPEAATTIPEATTTTPEEDDDCTDEAEDAAAESDEAAEKAVKKELARIKKEAMKNLTEAKTGKGKGGKGKEPPATTTEPAPTTTAPPATTTADEEDDDDEDDGDCEDDDDSQTTTDEPCPEEEEDDATTTVDVKTTTVGANATTVNALTTNLPTAGPLALTTFSTTGQASTTAGTQAYHELTCKYNKSRTMGKPGDHQEPSFAFDDKDWDDLTHKRERKVHTQGERIESMHRITDAMSKFMDKYLPHVSWWATCGYLIATVRSGMLIPWDMDGDIGVDVAEFNTAKTWDILKGMSGVKDLNSAECKKKTKGCMWVPFPSDIDPGENLGFALPMMPMPLDKFANMGRFIDLKTGYFVEILYEVKAEKTKKCAVSGTSVNVPENPVDYLASTWHARQIHSGLRRQPDEAIEFLGYKVPGMSCKMRKCSGEPLPPDTKGDPFTVVFTRGENKDGQAAWDPTNEKSKWGTCSDATDFKKDEKVFVKASTCLEVTNGTSGAESSM